MVYPEFIKMGDCIGVTAPSDGNSKQVDYVRLNHAKDVLAEKGYQVVETRNVRTSEKGRSSHAESRAQQVMDLFENDEVKVCIAAKGGDFLVEILPFLDYHRMKQSPKWFQGYSDSTGLGFTITTMCDVATIYCNNFNDFGMQEWHPSINNNLAILEGQNIIQKSFDTCEEGFHEKVHGLEGYHKDTAVRWINARGERKIEMEGRLLGGCLDVLLNLVGTQYDCVREFGIRYQEDGIIWFLESFDLGSEALIRGLWQLREAGWFEGAKGFVFGRPAMYRTFSDTTYQEAVLSVLDQLNVPIILDADIGHRAPQFCIINGAIGQWRYEDNRGELKMKSQVN